MGGASPAVTGETGHGATATNGGGASAGGRGLTGCHCSGIGAKIRCLFALRARE